MSGRSRMRFALLGGGLLSLLLVARLLTPSASGAGTHQQLGLPVCMMTMLFGVRCPSCGMTTSWAYLTRGEFSRAIVVHAGGAMLGGSAWFISIWAIVSAANGRIWIGKPTLGAVAVWMVVIAGVTIVQWIIRMSC